MRRASILGPLASLLVAAAIAAPANAAEGITVAPASSSYPERALRLSVPEGPRISPAQLKIAENGDPVRKISLSTTEAPRATDFGVVLVIDASQSMHGAAIRRAMSAARQLANQRKDSQQLGIVVFNDTPQVLLSPSNDRAVISEALRATPRLQPQTHVFDAVDQALRLLAQARIAAGSIILLSDGADTGSLISAADVSARARAANVRIFTVGLRSRAFTQSELQGLAAAGRGRYVAAESVDDLGRIFRDLGAELASEYLIRYRSSQRAGRLVTVAVRVDGIPGVGSTTYRVPGGASFVLVKDSFWTSSTGILLASLLCALLLAISMAILMGRRFRRPNLRERVSGFVSPAGVPVAAGTPDLTITGEVARGIAERSLERTRWWAQFKEECEIGRVEIEPVKIVTGTALVTLVFGYLLWVAAAPVATVFALLIPFGVRTWLRWKLTQQRNLFADQLPDILQSSASAIRAGHGLTGALRMVTEEAPEPARSEFARIVSDEALGVPLDNALRVVEKRMNSRELHQIALVAELQRETGGNTAEVLDKVTESMRERGELRRLVRTLTAQGRLSRWVVTALPIVLLLIITVINPRYVDPLYSTTLGLVMLVAGAAFMTAGSLVIKKIVNFDV